MKNLKQIQFVNQNHLGLTAWKTIRQSFIIFVIIWCRCVGKFLNTETIDIYPVCVYYYLYFCSIECLDSELEDKIWYNFGNGIIYVKLCFFCLYLFSIKFKTSVRLLDVFSKHIYATTFSENYIWKRLIYKIFRYTHYT